MDDDFFGSLLDAIGTLIGAAAMSSDTTSIREGGPSPWGAQLAKLRDKPVTMAIPQHQGIQGIRDSDPDFNLADFLVHVGTMFSAYHEACDRGDLTAARRFVDEGTYADLATIAEKSGRRADGPRTWTIRKIMPATACHEDGLDLVRVSIVAVPSGSEEPLYEYWELIRKHGTLTKPGIDITRCPNCGGPVDGLDPTRCAYCGTRLADPALDWVVRKITVQ
jgi:predicted lipid-binding transport protein (Tim44 family)